MHKIVPLTAALIGLSLASTTVLANHKPGHQLPPGQDRVCLVTTDNPGSFNDVDVADTKWLPRPAADAQASNDPTRMRVFDYTNDPLVTGGTYASAEELCNEHFD